MQSQLLVSKAVAIWQKAHPDQDVPCYRVDVSDQSGELWDALAQWLTDENRPTGQLMMSGVGPLLWVQSGHVVLHMAAPLEHDAAKLAKLSNSVFEIDAGRGSMTE